MCVVLQVANGNSVDEDKQQPRVTKRPLFLLVMSSFSGLKYQSIHKDNMVQNFLLLISQIVEKRQVAQIHRYHQV